MNQRSPKAGMQRRVRKRIEIMADHIARPIECPHPPPPARNLQSTRSWLLYVALLIQEWL